MVREEGEEEPVGGRKEESRALRCVRCMRAPRVSWWELVSTWGGELTSQRRRRERWAGRTSPGRLCDRGGERALAGFWTRASAPPHTQKKGAATHGVVGERAGRSEGRGVNGARTIMVGGEERRQRVARWLRALGAGRV